MVLLLWLAPRLAPRQAPTQDDQAVTVLDRHGVWLGTVLSRSQDHTAVVPLEAIAPDFVTAILTAEDRRFYAHGGVDSWAVLRATAQNLRSRRVVSGASTITMQLARLLDPAPRTLPTKIQEAWQAWRLEAGMSKEAILAAYLNRLPMGGNIYGVEAAARLYFGTSAAQLTLAQAAYLAAIPQNPQNRSVWRTRQVYILEQMLAQRLIEAEAAYQAIREPVQVLPRQEGIMAAPHFLMRLAAGQPEAALIRSTLDATLQAHVSEQVRASVRNQAGGDQAAALVIDNATATVLAYVGSPDFTEAQTDAVQALRQPGSTLKPFLYGFALDQGRIEPRSILADVPTHYALPNARVYSPVDFSERFRGPVRVRLALANSLNIPAVRLLEQVGVPEFQDYLQQLGFTDLNQPPEFYGLGLALGGGEVSLWQLAQAFRLIPTAGQWLPLREHREALTVAPIAIGSLSTWHLLADILSDPQARAEAFGAESWLNLPFVAAVKTGTSNDFRDNWVVGSSVNYTVAVWVGNFDGRPMRNVAGEGSAAATNAAPLWHRIMMQLEPDWDLPPWPTPAGYEWLPICAGSGLRPQPDCPVVVSEWVRDFDAYTHVIDPTFRRVNGHLEVNLPPEYDPWLNRHDQTQLRIVSPQPAATYLYAPGAELILRSNQANPVTWYLNGEPLGTASSLSWPLTPGAWVLEARTAEQQDQLSFEVVTDLPAREPGFTLRTP